MCFILNVIFLMLLGENDLYGILGDSIRHVASRGYLLVVTVTSSDMYEELEKRCKRMDKLVKTTNEFLTSSAREMK